MEAPMTWYWWLLIAVAPLLVLIFACRLFISTATRSVTMKMDGELDAKLAETLTAIVIHGAGVESGYPGDEIPTALKSGTKPKKQGP